MIFNCWGAILAVIGMAPLIATPIGVALTNQITSDSSRDQMGDDMDLIELRFITFETNSTRCTLLKTIKGFLDIFPIYKL